MSHWDMREFTDPDKRKRNIRKARRLFSVELRRAYDRLRNSYDKSEIGSSLKHMHELLKVREMLEMAEKELEKKVSQTAPFKNLKQMLQKKNEQMKDLRRRLSKLVNHRIIKLIL